MSPAIVAGGGWLRSRPVDGRVQSGEDCDRWAGGSGSKGLAKTKQYLCVGGLLFWAEVCAVGRWI